MQFLKENKKYINTQLKGNISNILRFDIKDLYKTQKVQDFQLCHKCSRYLTSTLCAFCGQQNEVQVPQLSVRNQCSQQTMKSQQKGRQCMILCIDMSGSMNLSYPSRYRKINKDFIIRSIGQKQYDVLKTAIGQEEVVKNFKGIEMLINSGQNIRDVAMIFKQQLLHQKKNQIKKDLNKDSSQEMQYITRKEIIQIGVSKYLQKIQKEKPNTLITVVYFNTNIEIPSEKFKEKIIIPGIQQKTLEQMIQLGQFYAEIISVETIGNVGEKLVQNMTKIQPQGQTALTPALAFCLGLAKKFKHELHQIIVVTDGLSNIGIGQTEQQKQLQQSKLIYKKLALQYAIPSASIVNVIGFEDCSIGYDVIDQIISKTGGLPYNISFNEQKKEKIVTSDTIDFLNFQMVDGFCQSTKQFCFMTAIAIKASNKKIKLSVPEDLKRFLLIDKGNWISLDLGIRSVNEVFQICFTVQEDDFQDEYIKFTVVNQYKRKSKINFCMRQELVSVRKGDQNQAIADQSKTLAKQIQKKLKVHKIQEQDFAQYQNLQQKIQQNQQIAQQIDTEMLQKFKKKKKLIDQYDKNTDKLTKDKRTMMSRRHQTYKRRKASSDQDEGFI